MSRVIVLLLLAATVLPACRPLPADDIDGDVATDSTKKRIPWKTFRDGRRTAKRDGKPMFIDFGASWCPPCQMLDKRTLTDPGVIAVASSSYISIKVDVDKQKRLAELFNVEGLPTLVILSPEGKELRRISGFHSPTELRAWLERSSS